jgi:hypothetical protein
MSKFTIKQFGGSDDLMLVRKEKSKQPTPGLPPEHSSVVFMKQNEINELIEVLQNYAITGRNQEV